MTDERFKTELEALRPRVEGLAIQRLRQIDHADDLVQDVMTRAWEKRCQFDARRGPLVGWLIRIATNRIADVYRHRRFDYLLIDDYAPLSSDGTEWLSPLDVYVDPSPSPEELILARDSEMDEILRPLSSQWYLTVRADALGLSYLEISHLLDCPIGTVRSTLHRARLRMRIRHRELQHLS